ncbi:hypothetical protein ORM92_04445 [Bacillus cereus]|nr:hypothetical protein [Bacillus cereus]MDZ4410731.1 hypothetical protein [Bacillus cereus]MDZ4530403.1 hypothetical protein [Bacillus cereus]
MIWKIEESIIVMEIRLKLKIEIIFVDDAKDEEWVYKSYQIT